MRQRQPLVLSQEELEQHNDGFFKAMLGDIEMDAEIQALHVVIAYTYDHMRRAHASANRNFPNGHASANRQFPNGQDRLCCAI